MRLVPRAVLRNLAGVFIASQSSDTRIAVVCKVPPADSNTSHASNRFHLVFVWDVHRAARLCTAGSEQDAHFDFQLRDLLIP